MPENKTCPICGSPMNFRPAGVSKTSGKRYTAFYACPNQQCVDPRTGKPHTENVSQFPMVPQDDVAPRTPTGIGSGVTQPRDYDSENRGKVRHGIVVALVENTGSLDFSPATYAGIDALTEYVMTGKRPGGGVGSEGLTDQEDSDLPF